MGGNGKKRECSTNPYRTFKINGRYYWIFTVDSRRLFHWRRNVVGGMDGWAVNFYPLTYIDYQTGRLQKEMG